MLPAKARPHPCLCVEFYGPPSHIEVISIIGVPLGEHLTDAARPFYRALERHGPNDGFLLPGRSAGGARVLYPAWRNDHYFQWTLPPVRIRAFLVYAVEVGTADRLHRGRDTRVSADHDAY